MTDVYEFINVEYATCGAAPALMHMCGWLEVSKSGFYEWKSRPEAATAKEGTRLLVMEAFDDSDGTYGYRRVSWQLARWGVPAGPELVRALMRSWAWWPASRGHGGRRPPSRAQRARSPTW